MCFDVLCTLLYSLYLLFLIYINDLIDCCEICSEIYLFADDEKLFRHILQSSDNILLQSGLNELRDWTQHWY